MNILNRTLKLTFGAAVLAATLAACSTGSNTPAQSSNTGAPVATNAPQRSDVQRQPLARGLYELAYSAKQDAVFVASSGGFGADAAPSKVLRLNPETLQTVNEIGLERKAFGVVLDDQANRLYVGNTVDTSVTVVDTANNRVVGTVQLMEKVKNKDGKEAYTHDLRELVVDSPRHRLYVTGHSAEGSVLFVVDTRTLKVLKTIPGLGKAKAPGLYLDAKNHRIFTSNLLGEVVIVDTRSLAVTRRIQTSAAQPMNLVFDNKTGRLFATDQGAENITKYMAKVAPDYKAEHPGNRVLVLDVKSGKEIESIPTDTGPLALKLDAQRNRLYVTNRMAGTVSVFNSSTYVLVDTITLPDYPQSLALDEGRNVLYVTVKNNKDKPKDAKEDVVRVTLPNLR